LKVSLEDYADSHPETTIFEPFTVEIKNCIVEDMTFDVIED
jgi:hypothetical protein